MQASEHASKRAGQAACAVGINIILPGEQEKAVVSSGVGSAPLGWVWTMTLDLDLDVYVCNVRAVCNKVLWEDQLRLSADVDGTSMTKDPGCAEAARGS